MISIRHYIASSDSWDVEYPDLAHPYIDVIFVRDVHQFMETLHHKISCPYIMLTAGERRDQVTLKHLAYLDDPTIIAWFAIHHACEETHPNLNIS